MSFSNKKFYTEAIHRLIFRDSCIKLVCAIRMRNVSSFGFFMACLTHTIGENMVWHMGRTILHPRLILRYFRASSADPRMSGVNCEPLCRNKLLQVTGICNEVLGKKIC